MLRSILKIIALILVIALLYFWFLSPSHDRQWQAESALLPNVTIEDNTITIKNVRDFTYSNSDITELRYEDRAINIQDIEAAYFIIEPFSTWSAVGHTFLTFDIKDQKPLAFSVEARREHDESYSPVQGLFKKYELWYVWGNETDLIVRRGLYLDHPLHMYKLEIEPETAQRLFETLAIQTQELQTTPQFYNTLLTNCTNALAGFSNNMNKGSIPFHYSLFLTGYADEYLYKLGLIQTDKPFKQLVQDTYITDIVKEHHASEEFSKLLREEVR